LSQQKNQEQQQQQQQQEEEEQPFLQKCNRQQPTQKISNIPQRSHRSSSLFCHPASSSTTQGRGTVSNSSSGSSNGFKKLRQGITLGKTSILHFNKKKKRPLKNKPRSTGVSSSRDPVLNYSSSSTTFSKYSKTKNVVEGSSKNRNS
jgi:hypothetical protein